MQKFKEARDSEYNFKINWKKLAFNNIASNKVSRDKVFNIAKNFKYNEYQRGLASVVYKLF